MLAVDRKLRNRLVTQKKQRRPKSLAGNLAPRNRRAGVSAPIHVFLNIPFDRPFVDLFLAYIAGLASLGLFPRSSVEVAGGERRLDKIFGLIQACPYSVHDLSRVELDAKHPRTPRFNMPLELGLAIAWQTLNPEKHVWFVFEAKKHRIAKSMSDLNGTDVYIRGGRTNALFSELANAFVRERHQATVRQMQQVFLGLSEAMPGLRRNAGTKDPFKARLFNDLRIVARGLSDEYVA